MKKYRMMAVIALSTALITGCGGKTEGTDVQVDTENTEETVTEETTEAVKDTDEEAEGTEAAGTELPELKGVSQDLVIPYTEIRLRSDYEDMVAVYGECQEDSIFSSVAGGNEYRYPATYEGLDGEVCFNYDGDNKLSFVRWYYEASDAEELTEVTEGWEDKLTDMYGPKEEGGIVSNIDTWYVDGGAIMYTVMNSEESETYYMYLSYYSNEYISSIRK